jgi:PadR family transcriptional regulator PadR
MTAVGSDAELLRTQLFRGVLEMCLLAVLNDEPYYAYGLSLKLARHGLVGVSEGTIYPLLGRLERLGWVSGALISGGGGPPRKYYSVTKPGQDRLATWIQEWGSLSAAVLSCTGGAES